MTGKRHILYFQHTAHVSGAAWSLLQLIKSLDPSQYSCEVALKTNGPLSAELEGANIPTVINHRLYHISKAYPAFLPYWHWKGLLELMLVPFSVFAAWRICSKIKPDIVHINTTGLFPLAVGARLAGTKMIILHVREHWVKKPKDFRDTLKDLIVSRCVDRIIAITESNSKTFGFPKKTTVVHNWPDFEGRTGTSEIYSEYNIPKSNSVLVFMGGRIPAKGVMVLLNAMQLIKNKQVSLLILGGTGGERKGAVGLTRDILTFMGLPTFGQRVKILAGKLNNVILAPTTLSVQNIIQKSSVVVCPFIEPHFAKPAIEAGFRGKPVIISDGEEAYEAVINNMTGIIVPRNNPAALAQAIDRLTTNPEYAAELGANAQKHIETNFNRNESIRRIISIYREKPDVDS